MLERDLGKPEKVPVFNKTRQEVFKSANISGDLIKQVMKNLPDHSKLGKTELPMLLDTPDLAESQRIAKSLEAQQRLLTIYWYNQENGIDDEDTNAQLVNLYKPFLQHQDTSALTDEEVANSVLEFVKTRSVFVGHLNQSTTLVLYENIDGNLLPMREIETDHNQDCLIGDVTKVHEFFWQKDKVNGNYYKLFSSTKHNDEKGSRVDRIWLDSIDVSNLYKNNICPLSEQEWAYSYLAVLSQGYRGEINAVEFKKTNYVYTDTCKFDKYLRLIKRVSETLAIEEDLPSDCLMYTCEQNLCHKDGFDFNPDWIVDIYVHPLIFHKLSENSGHISSVHPDDFYQSQVQLVLDEKSGLSHLSFAEIQRRSVEIHQELLKGNLVSGLIVFQDKLFSLVEQYDPNDQSLQEVLVSLGNRFIISVGQKTNFEFDPLKLVLKPNISESNQKIIGNNLNDYVQIDGGEWSFIFQRAPDSNLLYFRNVIFPQYSRE